MLKRMILLIIALAVCLSVCACGKDTTPTDPKVPTEPSGNIAPTEPTEPIEPTEPTEPTEPGETVAAEKNITITVIHSDGTKKVLTCTTSEKYLSELLTEMELVTPESIVNGAFTVVDGEKAEQAIGLACWWLYEDGTLVSADVNQVKLEKDASYTLKYMTQNNVFSTEVDIVIVRMKIQCRFVGNKLILTEMTSKLGEEETKTSEGQYELTEAEDGTMHITFHFEDADNAFGNSTYTFKMEEDRIIIGDMILMVIHTKPTSPSVPVVDIVPDKYDYITGELPYYEMPESADTYDNRYYQVIQLTDPSNPEATFSFYFGFGGTTDTTVCEVSDYLCLNPCVEYRGHPDYAKRYGSTYFSFHFIPSTGFVTTISNEEYGPQYSGNRYCTEFTFNRAYDYALPSNYVSAEEPGTVWYTDKELSPNQYVSIDVMVYWAQEPFTTLRLYVTKSDIGWSLASVACTDQLVQKDNMYAELLGEQNWLSQERIDELLFHTKDMLMYADPSLKEESLTNDKFIIEYRKAGTGTYFEYASWSVDSHSELEDMRAYANMDIYAVTYRYGKDSSAQHYTYYFYIDEGAGEHGEDIYNLFAVDWVHHFRLGALVVIDYPGYYYD